jgi:succinoglycan biosynthesis protein ExoM
MRVVLAVCTRERPRMLARCLSSIAILHVPDDTDLSIVVIENTREATTTTKQCVAQHGFNYIHEPRLGIPFARNAAIDYASKSEADALLFLDDDQTVPPEWLLTMLQAWRTTGVGIVNCVLKWEFEESRHQKYFSAGSTGTGGCLISRPIFEALRFDEGIGHGGGSDIAFFGAARTLGAKRFVTHQTYATEWCPRERQTLRWILRRALRCGIARAQRGDIRALGGMKNFLRHAYFAARYPDAAPTHMRKSVKGLGSLLGAAGIRLAEYKRITGS